MIANRMHNIWNNVKAWFEGGRPSPSALEQFILDSVAGRLSGDLQRIFQAQVAGIRLVQASAGGRVRQFHFSEDASLPKFSVGHDETCIARIKCKSEDGNKHLIRIMLYKGVLSDISISPIIRNETQELQIIEVILWPENGKDFSSAVDRTEHGHKSDLSEI